MDMTDRRAVDAAVRLQAFEFLNAIQALHGDLLPYDVLVKGFLFNSIRVPLLGPQGIFKPAVLPELPLSIATAPPKSGRPRPYDDEDFEDGSISYCYRGKDPAHRDNVGLRQAMQRRVPLVYFRGLSPGRYAAVWPVYVVGDDPDRLRFRVQADAALSSAPADDGSVGDSAAGRRAYVTASIQRRLHQQFFRERVLAAYRCACAMCNLRHSGLLDAAHILPDGHPRGDPVVQNGLALCKIHHAAFDQNIIGLRPDFQLTVRPDVLEEADGPMLEYGLKRMHERAILLPRRIQDRPDQDRVAARYDEFRRAC